MEDSTDLPGIGQTTFEIKLSIPFRQEEVLDELIVLNNAEKDFEGSYRTRVEYLDVFKHSQFLYKYSEFLHFEKPQLKNKQQ